MQLRTDKGDVGVWKERIGRGEGKCRLCRGMVESSLHIVFECAWSMPSRSYWWRSWDELAMMCL